MSTTPLRSHPILSSDSPPPGSVPSPNQPQGHQNGGELEAHLNQTERGGSSFCRALYDFNGRGPAELSFIKDEIIEIITRDPSGWWDGVVGQERGWFPSNYVVVITEVEARTAWAVA